jgi:hypothetical protein
MSDMPAAKKCDDETQYHRGVAKRKKISDAERALSLLKQLPPERSPLSAAVSHVAS